MAINLSKGGRINLSKEAPSLKLVGVGLGWNPNKTDTGSEFDLDTSVFLLDANGKTPTEQHFIFYNNLKSPDNAVEHTGDNRTGEGEGDDEVVNVDLEHVDPSIQEIIFVVTIHEAESRKQNFGQVSNSFIRIFNRETNEQTLIYELEEDFSTETAIEFGKLYRKDGEWRFQAVGDGFNSGLQGFVDKYTS